MQIVRDTLLIFRRQWRGSMRNPVWVIIGLIQPILYLSLFGPLLTHLRGVQGFSTENENPWQVYVPGLLVQLGLFGSMFVGFSIIGEWRMGVIERMRVTPVSRMALLMGRVLRDVLVLLTQSIILILAATLFGLHAPMGGVLIGLTIIALLAVSLSSLSYAAGLVTKSEDAFAPLLNMISVPLMLLSGILLPMSMAPPWLYRLCHINPFLYIVDAMRDVFLGHYATSTVAEGMFVSVTLAALSVVAGTRTFRKENA